MADSRSVEKQRAGSFRDRMREFLSVNRLPLAMWCGVLLVLLGFLAWAYYYGDQDSLKSASIGLGWFVGLTIGGSVIVVILRASRPSEKPADDLPLMDVNPVSPMSKKDDWDWWGQTIYPIGVLITGFITFVLSWIYCIATYGFLLGVGLGWLPSFIVAVITGYLWPLILIAIFILIVMITK